MNKVKPISPDEVVGKKEASIPNGVFEAFNELIARNWNGSYSMLKQCDVVNLISEKVGNGMGDGCGKKMIYDNHWLDVEDIYRATGWSVEYDKPGYNENYEPTFKFKKK
jgi:hypothetical protein